MFTRQTLHKVVPSGAPAPRRQAPSRTYTTTKRSYMQQHSPLSPFHPAPFPTRPSRPSSSLLPTRASSSNNTSTSSPSLIWFKHDLRIDDHPGLSAALQRKKDSGAPVHACFVLSPPLLNALLSLDPNQAQVDAEVLHRSLSHLRIELAKRGVPLAILRPSESAKSPGAAVAAFARSLSASTVHLEGEVEETWRAAVASLESDLIDSGARTELVRWNTRLYASPKLDGLDQYAKFQEVTRTLTPLAPVPAPEATSADEREQLEASEEVPAARELLQLAHSERLPAPPGPTEVAARAGLPILSAEDFMPYAQVPESFLTHSLAGRGCESALETLRQYLRNAAAEECEIARVAGKIERPAAPGMSFSALFRPALTLGLISPRRVYAEAQRVHETATKPFPNPFKDAEVTPAEAALSWAAVREFGNQLAEMFPGNPGPSGYETRAWSWRGVLSNYVYAPAEASTSTNGSGEERPAVLFVHGFGGFPEHGRRMYAPLAAKGYDVYGICLPGYGRSEKPSLPYSQYLWGQCVADFVRGVVKRPVILAGNSIGGFISTMVGASLTSAYVKGVVLLNSAGRIDAQFADQVRSNPAALDALRTRGTPPNVVVELATKGLFAYLQGSVAGQLKRLYPTHPECVDSWLEEEITRASGDPAAIGVFRSAFFLPSPVPINHNLMAADCPVLVLQGVLDVLNDSKKRAADMEVSCTKFRRWAAVERLNLGHCPMDENAAIVNESILRFLEGPVREFVREQKKDFVTSSP